MTTIPPLPTPVTNHATLIAHFSQGRAAVIVAAYLARRAA